jgi:hypothetical protein
MSIDLETIPLQQADSVDRLPTGTSAIIPFQNIIVYVLDPQLNPGTTIGA